MGWTIALTADKPIKYGRESWIHIQADANARGAISREPPQIFEEYHVMRSWGLSKEEALRFVKKKLVEESNGTP
jgi:hypothetical protein